MDRAENEFVAAGILLAIFRAVATFELAGETSALQFP
jgi:hypothetical protein